MDKTEAMNKKLYEKMSNEYESFCENLKTLPPEEIMRCSYEYIFKEDILMCFECGDMDYDKAKALHSLKYPLESIYQEWLSADYSYMDMLRDVIDTRANSALDEMKRIARSKER